MTPAWLQSTKEGTVIQIWVQPRASRNEIVGLLGEELKIRLTSPPVEGAANKLCLEYFADLLGVAKGKVRLVSGDKSRHKRLLVEGVKAAEVQKIIGPLLGPE